MQGCQVSDLQARRVNLKALSEELEINVYNFENWSFLILFFLTNKNDNIFHIIDQIYASRFLCESGIAIFAWRVTWTGNILLHV